MIILIETVILCILFTLMVYVMSKNPIKTLYNYPPKVIEKVKSLDEYKDKVPTAKNMVLVKTMVSFAIVIIVSLILRYINGYNTFTESFITSFIIWTIVNLYDVIVMDCLWFCKSPKFVFKGTENIINEYKNCWFHIKQGLIGQVIGTVVCIVTGLVVHFIL